jgi:peptide/nickel transport system ATP-binding protein
VPAPDNLPPGCVFEPRCDYAREACRAERPALRLLNPAAGPAAGHQTRCLFSEEIDPQAWTPLAEGERQPPEDSAAPATSGQPATVILEVSSLKTYYRHPNSSPLSLIGLGRREFVKAVDDVSFAVPQGKTLGVVGESGCGKSTLIKTIIGLENPTGGRASFMGFDINRRVSQRDLALIRELQMVFQNPDATMNPSYTVGQQIERPLRRFKLVPRAQVRDEVIRLLRAVKLDEYYYERFPRQLSGGEKQRVGIARAFAMEPKILLMDEPFGALDALTRASLQDELNGVLAKTGATVVMVTHDVDEAVLLADRIVMMTNGPAATIGDILDVGLARPRDRVALAADARFAACRAQVFDFLYRKQAHRQAA